MFSFTGSPSELTLISSIIIQDLLLQCNTRSHTALAYFYFDFNTTTKQELLYCLSSIVAQLCSQIKNVPDQIKKSYERCSSGKHQASIDEMRTMLFKVAESLDDVFIILDALDECPKNGEREQLLVALSEIMSQSCGNLHVLVTSRREPDIEQSLLPLLTHPAISVHGSGLDLDIKMYISWQLATDSRLKKWSAEIKSEIENSLTAGANGM